MPQATDAQRFLLKAKLKQVTGQIDARLSNIDAWLEDAGSDHQELDSVMREKSELEAEKRILAQQCETLANGAGHPPTEADVEAARKLANNITELNVQEAAETRVGLVRRVRALAETLVQVTGINGVE